MTSPTHSMQHSYAIVGTGAIGGYYGACLQQAGAEVHFLLRSDYDVVQRQGLRVDSVDGDFVLPQVNAYRDVMEMPLCDVVILALKTTQNHLLEKLLPPLLKDNGVVLVLQNGLGMEDLAAAIAGPQRVMGGLCFICSNKVGPGHIRHLDYKAIALGEYTPDHTPGGLTPRLEAIATDFEAANIPIRRTADLLLARWQKLLWNIPFNGLSVVLRATTQEMMADAAVRQLALEIMEEVGAIAAASGRPIAPTYLHDLIDHTDQMKPYLTSMRLDYDARRPLELDAIFNNPLQAAAQAGITVPRIDMLYRQLVFLDAQNR
ncbi:MAG: putative 2-dehydropantoate 2-reductase [Synechococcales bacterium]|nr:putative 2-dehydropantoate 2-reductase [Synechococcales bacterium]